MEYKPCWKHDIRSDCQKVPCLLWNPKVRYRVHKGVPLDPILIHLNPDHILMYNFLKMQLNIIVLATLTSPKRFLF
jgi:hypothetical protein